MPPGFEIPICCFPLPSLGELRVLGLGCFTCEGWEIARGLQCCYTSTWECCKNTQFSVGTQEVVYYEDPSVFEQCSVSIWREGNCWQQGLLDPTDSGYHAWSRISREMAWWKSKMEKIIKLWKSLNVCERKGWGQRWFCQDGVLGNRSRDLSSSLPPNSQKERGNGTGECLWRTLAEWKENKIQGQWTYM